MIEYKREIVYGSIMSLDNLNKLGKDGWILCAAVVMTNNSFNYLFYRNV